MFLKQKAFFVTIGMLILNITVSCNKDPSLFDIHNLNNNKIACFGHAGMGIGFKYPINSFESLNTCFDIGADGSEMDVQMTKDSVLVLFHDARLETATALSGIINDKTWNELQNLVFANPYSSNLKIRRLEDILFMFHNQNRIFTLDCKSYKSDDLTEDHYNSIFVNSLMKLIVKLKIENYVFIESHQKGFLQMLRNEAPDLKLFMVTSSFEEGMNSASQMKLFGISMSNNSISKSQIQEAHNKGFRITLWDIYSDKKNVNAIDKSPDYIQSDRIIHLLKVLNSFLYPKTDTHFSSQQITVKRQTKT